MTQPLDISLVGKPIDELTPAELASLGSQVLTLAKAIDERQKNLKATLEEDAFKSIAEWAFEAIKPLGFGKPPELNLKANAEGTAYTCAYVVKKVKGAGGRGKAEVNSGDITINKIGVAMGGIAEFRVGGQAVETLRAVMYLLRHPVTGEPETKRCYDITKKVGISASDIVTKYHAKEVAIVLNDGRELTVEDAITQMKAARTGAN